MSLDAAQIVGYLLIVLGLIGAMTPILPGPLLIWLGALVWAWGDGFSRVGWPTLVVMGVLAAAAWLSDLLLSTLVTRRAGASWKSIGGAMAGGLLGGLFLSALPVIGTLAGALLGALLGLWLVEYNDKRNAQAAWAALRAYLSSILLSMVLEVIIALWMVSIFVWQAFFVS